jgi:rhodanese-related sulfurtransferase
MLSMLKRLLGVEPAQAVPWIDCTELAARINAGRPPTIVDVRGGDEFDGPLGHIDGALNVPVDAILANPDAFAGHRNEAIVLVCRTDKRSARAADHLHTAGFTDLTVLRGGMESWSAAGLPLAARA